MSEINVNSLEPNSYKYKEEKAKKSKISPIITKDQIVSTKKPLSKKIFDTFLMDDSKDIKTWLMYDVLIPGVKNTVLDILSMMFFGEFYSRSKSSGSKNRRDDRRDDYRSYYRSSNERSKNRRDDRYDSDDRIDFRNIILRNRENAEDLVDEMRKKIKNDGSASVADLLDLIDASSRYTDNNYGWDDERDIGIRRVSSGYLIDIAEPKYLD